MADTTAEYTRLHITPLNPSILLTIIPASILPIARNISYHTIQTSPERAYGYVDLPAMEAEKLKKKLNGSILKGTKVRIEKARPEKVVSIGDDAIEPIEQPPLKEKKPSKRKRESLPGVEIGERSVKRGWTTPSAKLDKRKKKGKAGSVKSKYTSGKECLFKTVIPPNVASGIPPTVTKEVKLEKRKSKKGKEAVVHEFAKTTKYANFLRSSAGSQTKAVAEFIEGKGWVDSDGNVVEAPVKISRDSTKKAKRVKMEDVGSHKHPDEDELVRSASDDEASHLEDNSAPSEKPTRENEFPFSKEPEKPALRSGSSDTSTSGRDSDTDSDSNGSSSADESSEQEASSSEEEVSTENNIPRPTSSALKIQIPNPVLTITPAKGVHPLEALYKRPKTDTENTGLKPTPPSFNFFDAGDSDDLDDESTHQVRMPMTPFTQKDFEFRGIRSAAPTPDTAHANKRFIWPTDKDEDDVDGGEVEASSPIRKSSISQKGDTGKAVAPESDFQKWFWENRGEANRAWKKRRKSVAKEKRQRENRKRGDTAA